MLAEEHSVNRRPRQVRLSSRPELTSGSRYLITAAHNCPWTVKCKWLLKHFETVYFSYFLLEIMSKYVKSSGYQMIFFSSVWSWVRHWEEDATPATAQICPNTYLTYSHFISFALRSHKSAWIWLNYLKTVWGAAFSSFQMIGNSSDWLDSPCHRSYHGLQFFSSLRRATFTLQKLHILMLLQLLSKIC